MAVVLAAFAARSRTCAGVGRKPSLASTPLCGVGVAATSSARERVYARESIFCRPDDSSVVGNAEEPSGKNPCVDRNPFDVSSLRTLSPARLHHRLPPCRPSSCSSPRRLRARNGRSHLECIFLFFLPRSIRGRSSTADAPLFVRSVPLNHRAPADEIRFLSHRIHTNRSRISVRLRKTSTGDTQLPLSSVPASVHSLQQPRVGTEPSTRQFF